MDRDARKMRGDRPFLFTNLRAGVGVPELTAWVRKEMSRPPDSEAQSRHGEGSRRPACAAFSLARALTRLAQTRSGSLQRRMAGVPVGPKSILAPTTQVARRHPGRARRCPPQCDRAHAPRHGPSRGRAEHSLEADSPLAWHFVPRRECYRNPDRRTGELRRSLRATSRAGQAVRNAGGPSISQRPTSFTTTRSPLTPWEGSARCQRKETPDFFRMWAASRPISRMATREYRPSGITTAVTGVGWPARTEASAKNQSKRTTYVV